MSHFGVVAPAFYSHFQVFNALATELLDRGHQVTFFQQADAQGWLKDSRIGFHPLGATSHPPGTLEPSLRRAACSNNPLGIRRVIQDMCLTTTMLSDELPDALASENVDALLCDQMEAAGGLVAEALGIDYVSVACALPVNREPDLPLPVMPFSYGTDDRSRRIYRGSQQVYDWLMRPLRGTVRDACRRLAIGPRDGLQDCLSPFAQLSQTVPAFDLPRRHLPGHFHSVGPMRSPAKFEPAHWPIASDRPFVFASLGTLQGGRLGIFQQICAACRCIDAQLLVAHCGALNRMQEVSLLKLGANWVTDFAPQRWALERANVVVTHGGLNTVMDSIIAGTPMLVMPIAFDQPGIAARVTYRGLGEQLHYRSNATKIQASLERLLDHPINPLLQINAQLATAGGVTRASNIIERVVRTHSPVVAELNHDI